MKLKDLLAPSRRELVIGILFVLVVPLCAHLLYSKYGFNPTDDGFILAGSKRILDGEVPHKDFISIRTTGSLYLHAPFVALGGDYTIWLSRLFVWFEFAVIAWMWTLLISRSLKVLADPVMKFAFALVVMVFSVHVFPIMAWHSIDAMFATSIGLVLCANESPRMKALGYLVLGSSILFRQNFAIMVVVGLVVMKDWKRVRYWIAVALPGAAYVGFVAAAGGFHDMVLQLTTFGGESLVWEGGGKYVKNVGALLGVGIGYLSAALLYAKFWRFRELKDSSWPKIASYMVMIGIPAAAAIVLALRGTDYVQIPSFALFGLGIGVTVHLLQMDKSFTPRVASGILVLFNAWSVSLSGGYNTPALGTGPLVVFLAANALTSIPSLNVPDVMRMGHASRVSDKIGKTAAIVLIIVCLISAPIAKVQHVYLEPSVGKLNYDLGDVLYGGRMIETDRNTYLMLKDLHNATEIAVVQGKEYVIIPDLAAAWIGSGQRNPIPSDWPQNVELTSDKLLERVEKFLEDGRGEIMIIVEKFETSKMGSERVPLSDSYKIVQFVKANFSFAGQSDYFEFYA